MKRRKKGQGLKIDQSPQVKVPNPLRLVRLGGQYENLSEEVFASKANDDGCDQCWKEFFPIEFLETPDCDDQEKCCHPSKRHQPQVKHQAVDYGR